MKIFKSWVLSLIFGCIALGISMYIDYHYQIALDELGELREIVTLFRMGKETRFLLSLMECLCFFSAVHALVYEKKWLGIFGIILLIFVLNQDIMGPFYYEFNF